MKNTTSLVLSAVLAAAMAASGCAKLQVSPTEQQSSVVNVLSDTLTLPAPDNSYSVRQAGQARASGSNVQTLMSNIFNRVAIGLKEVNMHLGQTVAEGTSSNGSLNITNKSLQSSLVGTRDDDHGLINYTYTLGGVTYFTASVQNTGISGSVDLPASGLSAASSVSFQIQTNPFQKTVTIINSQWGNMTLVMKYAGSTSSAVPSQVDMTGQISGVSVSGSWKTTTGGSFTDTTGVKKCFDVNLQDVSC